MRIWNALLVVVGLLVARIGYRLLFESSRDRARTFVADAAAELAAEAGVSWRDVLGRTRRAS